MPPDMLKALKPEFVAPLVGVLCAKDNVSACVCVCHLDWYARLTGSHYYGIQGLPPVSGRIFEVGAGFVAEVRWEESKGVVFKTDESFTPSAVSLCVSHGRRNHELAGLLWLENL